MEKDVLYTIDGKLEELRCFGRGVIQRMRSRKCEVLTRRGEIIGKGTVGSSYKERLRVKKNQWLNYEVVLEGTEDARMRHYR